MISITNWPCRIVLTVLTGLLIGCHDRVPIRKSAAQEPSLFTLLNQADTHIDFNNGLSEGPNTNVMMYEYFYNGGGVAIGDVNNDGLQDIYFLSNLGSSKLYLNKGNMKFEDITSKANAQVRPGPWKTGVTMADVNGDGKLDIYVCYSGKLPGAKRANQLFVNDGNDFNGIPLFREQAAEYGLADTSYSTQGYFFDYDRDGDLDMFLLNHNPDNLQILDEAGTAALLKIKNANTGVKLFRNDGNHFSEVTEQAGISSSALTYGLGAGIADINKDGWMDIYISNDYGVPDYLYINNKHGGFSNKLETSIGHTSHFSMGNNISDINNDGLPDIFTLDMLPEDNHRQKLLFQPDNYEKFDLSLRTGFYYQYMRNMLQLNNGDGTFSEIGQLAGISNTDWSWAPLFADFDNDGWKDLYITNGYLRDYTNMDFMKYMNDYIQAKGRLNKEEVMQLIKKIPSSNVTNYMYHSRGDLTFENTGLAWGLRTPSVSSGAAYADLDNDGDLDLVVNNINQPAFIYRNNEATQLKNNYLEVKLLGDQKNTDGIGASVSIYKDAKCQFVEQMPARGFQSSVTSVLHFGLGKDSVIDSLKIIWPSGKGQLLTNIPGNHLLTLSEGDADRNFYGSRLMKPAFEETSPVINFRQQITGINDFKRQPLLINPMSFFGPCLIKGDVNGDGLEDIYSKGESGQAGELFIQQPDHRFIRKEEPAFEQDKLCEDADAIFVDVNNDGFKDLYAASGGYGSLSATDTLLQDRLYINNGKGDFVKATTALPTMLVSKGCVRAADINGDGFADLFVGGRSIPGQYPETPQSFFLINDGKGNFKDETQALAPQLQRLGMITDAAWTDINNDKQPDLIVVGEWMPVSIFINDKGRLENKTTTYFSEEYGGWWNKLLVEDLNGDGKNDLVVGNMGANTQCRATDSEPAELYCKDFDNNGSVDPILCFYIQHKSYPYVTRDELLDQISSMRTRFTDYKSYADAGIKDVFTSDELKDAKRLTANRLNTSYFQFGSDGRFHEKALPIQAQFSPVMTITSLDYDRDGKRDLLLCGNINHARLRFGKCDANYGVLLKGEGNGNFKYISQAESGFHLWGDVRSVIEINDQLLFGMNQNIVKAYKKMDSLHRKFK